MLDLTTESLNTVMLEKIHIYSRANIGRSCLMDMKGTSYIDFITQDMILQLEAYVLGRKETIKTFVYPVDWWQAVRQRWAPKWWLKRYPVINTTETVDVEAVWPTFKVAIPDHQPRLQLLVSKRGPYVQF
jgi:hypothetical protein